MTIKEYYDNYKSNKKYPIVLTDDDAVTIDDFYAKSIKKHVLCQQSEKENVIAWHNMLLEYVERDDAVFWIRYYESGNKKNGRWNNRRACKTNFKHGNKEKSYVFVSNYDAHEIFNMVRLGVKPDVNEFLELMKNHEFKLHYDSGKSCEESDVCSYEKIGTVKGGVLTVEHWYLAHIIGIKSDNYLDTSSNNPIEIDVERLYPRGEISDWNKREGQYLVRELDYIFTDDDMKLIKAHFLRFVDPLNYYVVPGKSYQENGTEKAQIGEYNSMNAYMSDKFNQIYGQKVMDEYRKVILAPSFPKANGKENINIKYGLQVVRNKSTSKKSSKANKQGSTATTSRKIPSGYNKKVVFDILNDIVNNGKMTVMLLEDLQKKDYASGNFKVSYPILLKETDFANLGYKRIKFYSKEKIEINGDEYLVCSQWIPERIAMLQDWYKNL